MINTFPELQANEVIVLVQETPFSDAYYQVKISDEDFKKLCKIINKKKKGFILNTYPEKYSVIDYPLDHTIND